MDSLGRLTEILELKFIQRVESCQIHHHGSKLIIGEELKKMFRLTVIIATLLGCVGMATAQPKKVPRIGYLSVRDPAGESTRSEAIRAALRELGYIEGQNIAIEYRYGEGKRDRYPELAAELVRLKVDIIVAGTP
jgi:ABC-type uncharacterized transport system substrate-binding protein